jgi:hypothetical protein
MKILWKPLQARDKETESKYSSLTSIVLVLVLLNDFPLQNLAHRLSVKPAGETNEKKRRGECTIVKARHWNVSLRPIMSLRTVLMTNLRKSWFSFSRHDVTM